MWFRGRRDLYVVETEHLSRELQVGACRAALHFVGARAERLQTDVPWARAGLWPADVVEAASRLAPRDPEYATSGWITSIDDRLWQAYVTFAPFAFSTDVWTADMELLGHVDDEATSIVVRIPVSIREELRRSVAPARVVPLARRGLRRPRT